MAKLLSLWMCRIIAGNLIIGFLCSVPLLAQRAETIMVERLVVDARITAFDGTPLTDIEPGDLEVTIGGHPARIEAVEFHRDNAFRLGVAGPEPRAGTSSTPGRLLIYFFQTDFQRVRAAGQMRMITGALEMLERLQPGDRVAVVSHDSHLKLLQDFTSDRTLLSSAIRRSIEIGATPEHVSSGEVSLSRHLTRAQARRASKPEQALLALARALMKIDGPKAIVFFGWGLGHYGSGRVSHEREWSPARQLLEDARTQIFVLDTSSADYHSLEVALRDAAEKTGGFYEKTHVFSGQAVARLERTLAGRYEISVVIEEMPRGVHPIQVKLVGRRGVVLAPSTSTLR